MHGDEMVMPSLMGARVLSVQNDPFVAADLDLMIDGAEGKVAAIATSREDASSTGKHLTSAILSVGVEPQRSQ